MFDLRVMVRTFHQISQKHSVLLHSILNRYIYLLLEKHLIYSFKYDKTLIVPWNKQHAVEESKSAYLTILLLRTIVNLVSTNTLSTTISTFKRIVNLKFRFKIFDLTIECFWTYFFKVSWQVAFWHCINSKKSFTINLLPAH